MALISLRQLLDHAAEHAYGVPAFNINNMEQGIAILLVSSELPELTLLSDRILVMREGRPTAILGRSDFAHETILEYASPGGLVQPEFEDREVA